MRTPLQEAAAQKRAGLQSAGLAAREAKHSREAAKAALAAAEDEVERMRRGRAAELAGMREKVGVGMGRGSTRAGSWEGMGWVGLAARGPAVCVLGGA